MPKWLDFQKIVATIYRELEPGATVTHDDKIMGKDSGIKRQIDVSIRATVAGQSILIIVQAKDYSVPADVNSVGEFSAVMRDVGASKGVMVCNAGFTPAAQTLARNLGMDLCNAVDIESRVWTKDIQVPVVWHQRIPIVTPQLRLRLEAGDEIGTNLNEWLFSADGGITSKSLSQKFAEDWNAGIISKSAGHRVRLKVTVPNLLFGAGSARWRPVTELFIEYVVVENYWLKYFAPLEYRAISSYLTGNVDVSKVNIGKLGFDLSDGWQTLSVEDRFPIEPCGVIIQVEQPLLDPRLSQSMSVSLIEEPDW